LSRLLEIELEERRERKVDLLQRFAAFPYKKSLEQFDFDFQPTVDRRLIADLATLRFLDHAENVILVGPPGTAKTMISIGLGLKATEAGRRVLFTTADDLVGALSRAFEENRLEEKLKVYTTFGLERRKSLRGRGFGVYRAGTSQGFSQIAASTGGSDPPPLNETGRPQARAAGSS